jgi:type II secretory pathway pseudopilin PulG
MMHHPIKAVKRRGFTALELIIVLVVGFSIIALSASKMGQLFSASTTTSAMANILEIFTSVRSLRGATGYGNQENLIASLIKANMVPKSLAISQVTENNNSKDVLFNEWKGEINITSVGENNEIGFDLTYDKVPGDACAKIAQNLLHSGNFLAIIIGGDEIKVESKVTEVVNSCAGDNGGKGVEMVFQFRE